MLRPCVSGVRDAQCGFGSICALSWSLQGVLGTWHWQLDNSTCPCCPCLAAAVWAAVCLVGMMLQSKFHLFLSIFTTDSTTGKGTWSKCPPLPVPCDGGCLACLCHVPASCLGCVPPRAAFPAWGRGCGRTAAAPCSAQVLCRASWFSLGVSLWFFGSCSCLAVAGSGQLRVPVPRGDLVAPPRSCCRCTACVSCW